MRDAGTVPTLRECAIVLRNQLKHPGGALRLGYRRALAAGVVPGPPVRGDSFVTRDALPAFDPLDPSSSTPASHAEHAPAARRQRLARWALATVFVAALAACGGGGGGDDGDDPPPPGGYTGPVTVTGVATYQFVPTQADHTGLDYANSVDRPIRGATVQLVNAGGTVVGTTTSGADGSYTFSLPAATGVSVRVRAEIARPASAGVGARDIQVVDNTAGGALYTVSSAVVVPTAAAQTINVRAASGWDGTSYATARAAGPYAILDTVYAAQAKVAAAAPTRDLPQLRVNWSVNNKPASGSVANGDIGTSYFTLSGGVPSLFILGAANTDTDEYDTHVIAHEFGHYLQYAISRDDSVGSGHGGGDKLDLRVAFSEGWGNGWSGIVLDDPYYTDSYSTGQNSGFFLNVGQPATGGDRGAYSETTAQYLVYAAHAAVGFTPIYNALTAMATSPAFSTLYSFAAYLKAAGADATTVNNLWASQNVVASDVYGTGETNDGGDAFNLPVYKDYGSTLGVTQNHCVYAKNDARGDGNKLGEFVYLRFTVSGSRTISVNRTSASYAGATDPDFLLITSAGTESGSFSGTADAETFTLTLPTGTHVLALQDYKLTEQPVSATSCFNVRID